MSEETNETIADQEVSTKTNGYTAEYTSQETNEGTDMEQIIYMGPQILKKGLLSGQVFIGGVPEHIKECAKDKPLMNQLFVPVSQIVEAQQAINTPGTPQYIAYHDVLGGK